MRPRQRCPLRSSQRRTSATADQSLCSAHHGRRSRSSPAWRHALGQVVGRLNGEYHVVVEPDIWSILTAIGTVVALLGIIVALYFNRRSLALDRRNGEATAARAEAAAAMSADSTDRIVEALGAISLAEAGSASPAPRFTWSLEKVSGSMYRLTNTGNAKAWHVKIDSDESLDLIDVPEDRDLDTTEAVSFYAAPSLATRDMTITVTWDGDEQGSPGGTWRYPLPP